MIQESREQLRLNHHRERKVHFALDRAQDQWERRTCSLIYLVLVHSSMSKKRLLLKSLKRNWSHSKVLSTFYCIRDNEQDFWSISDELEPNDGSWFDSSLPRREDRRDSTQRSLYPCRSCIVFTLFALVNPRLRLIEQVEWIGTTVRPCAGTTVPDSRRAHFKIRS